jgi:hypothetical protein
MPDERTSTAIPATAEPTSRLRITKLLSGSAFQSSTQVVILAYGEANIHPGLRSNPY